MTKRESRDGRDHDPSTARAGSMWSHTEYIRVLQAWRFVLQTQTQKETPSSASTAALVPDDVARRTFARFAELTERDDRSPTCRSVDSMTRKMEALMRAYRVIVAYNEQQVVRQREHRQKRTPQHNFWLALSLAKQQRAFAAYFAANTFIAVDAEMFALLSAIDRARSHAQAHVKSHSKLAKTSSAWTKGEEWVLVNAWRQAVETTADNNGDSDGAQEHTLSRIYSRFCALARPGMPRRTKGSVKAKVANLAVLYKLVKDFNARGHYQRRSRHDSASRRRQPSGPHGNDDDDGNGDDGDDDSGQRDWFSASSDAKAQHLIESNVGRVYRIAEFDKDTFHAMELIMAHVSGDVTRSGASHAIIELFSDTEVDGDGDDGGESEWELLPAHSVQSSTAAWTARVEYAPPPPLPLTAALDSDSPSIERARKRAKVSSEQETGESKPEAAATTSETEQRFLTLLAKLKHERRADKAKRRAERHEREALTALIAEERKLRRQDKKERQRERRAWELERDKLKLKLKSMREKYKRARRALTAS